MNLESISPRAAPNNNHKHPWMGLVLPFAKPTTLRASLPVICRPIERRATGPRGI